MPHVSHEKEIQTVTNEELFSSQMKLLKDFLERGAITQAQYDHSAKVLIEKIPHKVIQK